MTKKKLEIRMMGFVPYNISEIQKGIQFGHAVVEYARKYGKDLDYKLWAERDKTFIILNGGTTNNGDNVDYNSGTDRKVSYVGSIQQHNLALINNKVKCAEFYEPDLNDTLTAVVFLVDERVFNKTKYPDWKYVYRGFDGDEETQYAEWVEKIGGPKIAFLRDFLKDKRLA